jgi:phosphoglycerate dehydrogenase-like enzyme
MRANRVLVAVPHLYDREAPYLRRLESAGLEVVRRIGKERKLSEDELIDALPGVFGTVAGSEPYTERVFKNAPDLRVIGRWGVGYDAIDVEAATRHQVAVCVAAGGNHEAVADYAFALMAALQRGLRDNTTRVCQGRWETSFRPGLWRSAVGIVGLGRIGKAVARRCRGFDMRILATEPAPDMGFVREHGIELLPLEDLLRRADLITLHCPLSPATRHMINAERLVLMKPSAYLVNTARGPLVDDTALIAALKSGKLAAAGLDVYTGEPNIDPGYRPLPNTFLLPHLGSATTETRNAMGFKALDNLDAFFAGRPLPARVA